MFGYLFTGLANRIDYFYARASRFTYLFSSYVFSIYVVIWSGLFDFIRACVPKEIIPVQFVPASSEEVGIPRFIVWLRGPVPSES